MRSTTSATGRTSLFCFKGLTCMNVIYALEIGSYNFEKRTKGYCLHLQRPLKPGKGALHAGHLSTGHLWAGAGPPGSGPLSDRDLVNNLPNQVPIVHTGIRNSGVVCAAPDPHCCQCAVLRNARPMPQIEAPKAGAAKSSVGVIDYVRMSKTTGNYVLVQEYKTESSFRCAMRSL